MHGLKAFELGFPAGLGNTSIAIAYTQGRYGYTPKNTVLARLWGCNPLLLPNVQVMLLRLISMATPHRLTCILPAVYGRYPNRWLEHAHVLHDL